MADSVRDIFAGVARGLKDSILGMLKIYHIDSKGKEEKPETPQKPEQMSTLARRRAERMQHKEVKKDRYVLRNTIKYGEKETLDE